MNEKRLTSKDFNQIKQVMQDIWQQAQDAKKVRRI